MAKLTLGFVDSSFFFIYRLCCTSLQFYIFFLCDKKIRSCLLLHSTLRTVVEKCYYGIVNKNGLFSFPERPVLAQPIFVFEKKDRPLKVKSFFFFFIIDIKMLRSEDSVDNDPSSSKRF